MAGRLQYEGVRAIREMQSARSLGVMTLTVANQTVAYTPSSSTFARMMGAGGFGQDVAASFLVERALFKTIPKSAALLVDNRDGKRYRVTTVNESADGSYVKLDCSDAAQKI
jgi:hypothetical protein